MKLTIRVGIDVYTVEARDGADGYTCEASSLQWKPNFWPKTCTIECATFRFKVAMYRAERIANGDELGGYVYVSNDEKVRLTVFND
jgi:hypothetical protein